MTDVINPLYKDPNFVTNTKNLLPTQFRNKQNISLITEWIAEEMSDAIDLVLEIPSRHIINTAEGVYLENVGNKLGIPRTSEDDDTYRNAILLATKGVSLNVTRDGIIELLKTVVADDDMIVYKSKPSFVDLNFYSGCAQNIQSLESFAEMFPLMTDLHISVREGVPFGFMDEADTTIPTNIRGFGDDSEEYPDDGHFACTVYTNENM